MVDRLPKSCYRVAVKSTGGRDARFCRDATVADVRMIVHRLSRVYGPERVVVGHNSPGDLPALPPSPLPVCHRCGADDHSTRSCTAEVDIFGAPIGPRVGSRGCARCGQWGHFSLDCFKGWH